MKGIVKPLLFGVGVGFGLFAGAGVFIYGANIGYTAKERSDMNSDPASEEILRKLEDCDDQLVESIQSMKDSGAI